MTKLPPIHDGVLTLEAKTYALDAPLRVDETLRIVGAKGACLECSFAGPAIEVAGEASLSDLTLARVGGWGGLLWVTGRCVAKRVRFEGATGWERAQLPRPAEPDWRTDSAVSVGDGGHVTLERAAWVRCRAPLASTSEQSRLTIKGGEAHECLEGFSVYGARFSLSDFESAGLERALEGRVGACEVLLRRCTFTECKGDCISIGQATTLDAVKLVLRGGRVALVAAGETETKLRDCCFEDQSAGAVIAHVEASMELSESVLRGSGGAGLFLAGRGRARLVDCTLEGNLHGALASCESRLLLRGVRVRRNQKRGVQASDLAEVQEVDCEIGGNSGGDRYRYDFASWSGHDVSREPRDGDVLDWLRQRLAHPWGSVPDRRALLEALPACFEGDDDALWLVSRTQEIADAFSYRGLVAVDELLLALSPSARASRLIERLASPPVEGARLVLQRHFAREDLTCLAGWRAEDGAQALLTASKDGRVERWSLEGAEAYHDVSTAVADLHVAHGRVAICAGERAWLFDLESGELLGQWSARWEDAAMVRVVSEREVDLYSHETNGHPGERSGYRRRLRVGEPLVHADFLARRQFNPPPLGATGIKWVPSDRERAPEVLPAPEGGGFLHVDGGRVCWTRDVEASEEIAAWQAGSYDPDVTVYAERVIVRSARGLHVLRCVPADILLAPDP